MENSISTNVVKLDLKTILRNYKKPEFWQKHWTIIDTEFMKIEWFLYSIGCKSNKITSTVKVTHKNFNLKNKELNHKWYTDEETDLPSIPIGNKEYTQQHFEKALYGSIMNLIKDIERHMIYYYAEYKAAEEAQEKYKDELEKIANEFLDAEGVTNEDIRYAYVHSFRDEQYDQSDIRNMTSTIVMNYEYKVITEAYIYAAAWFNNKEDYEKYSNILYKDHKKKSEMLAIWKTCREIQTAKWKNSMKEELKGIKD